MEAVSCVTGHLSDVTPGYERVGRLVMVPQSVGEPLGISKELLDCQRHDHLARISSINLLIKLKKGRGYKLRLIKKINIIYQIRS